MPAGGKRNPPGGRPSTTMKHQILLRDYQPGRYERYEAGELSALDVMRDNMEFFHRRAAELLATIMALPIADATADQLAAFHDFAGLIKCRELSQSCARDLAKYVHAPVAPAPAVAPAAASRPALEHIPTPKAVSDAFALAAAGLPPEPRKRL